MTDIKQTNLFWRIVISSVGAALIIMAVVSILLFFFGSHTTATITTRRVGGADDNRPVSQRYEWSVDYDFKDMQESIYSGHSTRRGNDIAVMTEKGVYYFAFAPFINTLESEAEPNWGQLLYITIGLILIFAVNRKKCKKISTIPQK